MLVRVLITSCESYIVIFFLEISRQIAFWSWRPGSGWVGLGLAGPGWIGLDRARPSRFIVDIDFMVKKPLYAPYKKTLSISSFRVYVLFEMPYYRVDRSYLLRECSVLFRAARIHCLECYMEPYFVWHTCIFSGASIISESFKTLFVSIFTICIPRNIRCSILNLHSSWR